MLGEKTTMNLIVEKSKYMSITPTSTKYSNKYRHSKNTIGLSLTWIQIVLILDCRLTL